MSETANPSAGDEANSSADLSAGDVASANTNDGAESPAGDKRALMRSTFRDPVTLALLALTIPLASWGVLRTAFDAQDRGFFTSFLLTATATLPTAWAIVRVIWSERASEAITVALLRTLVVPLVVAWPPALAAAITAYVPAIHHRIVTSRSDIGWRYHFAENDGSLLGQTLGLGGLIGVLFAGLTALVLCVFVVIPALAWFNPIGAAKSNMMLTETSEDRAAATVGIRVLSVFLMLTFAVPTLIVFGKEEASAASLGEAFSLTPRFFAEPQEYTGELLWVLGVLLIPLGVVAVLWLVAVQRPDKAARARAGVNSLADQKAYEAELRSAAELSNSAETSAAETQTAETSYEAESTRSTSACASDCTCARCSAPRNDSA